MTCHDCAACIVAGCCTPGWCLDTADCTAHCPCLSCDAIRCANGDRIYGWHVESARQAQPIRVRPAAQRKQLFSARRAHD